MSKRGQALPLNTLIIIILVVIALIVIAVFFLGGTSQLSKSIRSIFYGTTAGTDEALAENTCRQRCEEARSIGRGRTAPVCKITFDIDRDNDGDVEGADEKDQKCEKLGVQCNDVCNRDDTTASDT